MELESAAEKVIQSFRNKAKGIWRMGKVIEMLWFYASTPFSKLREQKFKSTIDTNDFVRLHFNLNVFQEKYPPPSFDFDEQLIPKIVCDLYSLSLLSEVFLDPESDPLDVLLGLIPEMDLKAALLIEQAQIIEGRLFSKIQMKIQGKRNISSRSRQSEADRKDIEQLYEEMGNSIKFRLLAQQKTGKSERTIMNHLKKIKENASAFGGMNLRENMEKVKNSHLNGADSLEPSAGGGGIKYDLGT